MKEEKTKMIRITPKHSENRQSVVFVDKITYVSSEVSTLGDEYCEIHFVDGTSLTVEENINGIIEMSQLENITV